MKLFDPDPSLRWLFLMTHPDDEISVAGWIRRLVLAGNQVSMAWAHSTPVREAESRCAAKSLGVPSERLTFLALEDGKLVYQLPRLVETLNPLLRSDQFDRVAVTAFEQGHLDHDSVCFAAYELFDGPILQYPMYYPYSRILQKLQRFPSTEGVERLQLAPPESKEKWRLLDSYPSQTIKRNALLHHWLLSWLPGNERLDTREFLRYQREIDFGVPNHSGPMRKELERHKKWSIWLQNLREYKS